MGNYITHERELLFLQARNHGYVPEGVQDLRAFLLPLIRSVNVRMGKTLFGEIKPSDFWASQVIEMITLAKLPRSIGSQILDVVTTEFNPRFVRCYQEMKDFVAAV